jgi:hypothetical protein
MKIFTVIYSIGGFAREDFSNPAVAGIFTDEKIANIVCKATGSNAKVVPLELDYIAPGYISFAKEVLGINLVKLMEEQEANLEEMSEFNRKCLMTAEDFETDHKSGFLLSCDGSGNWATEKMISNISCFNTRPEWATHVCWFNN